MVSFLILSFLKLDTRGHYELLLDGKECRCKNFSKMYFTEKKKKKENSYRFDKT